MNSNGCRNCESIKTYSVELNKSCTPHPSPVSSTENIASVISSTNNSSVSILSATSSVTSAPAKYRPTPYTFKIPRNASLRSNDYVQCPPFHLLLDHALAVIWSMFSKQKIKCKLGIVQLEWALKFLKQIPKNNCYFRGDVAICIEVIEDTLIEHYAHLAEQAQKDNNSWFCCNSRNNSDTNIQEDKTTARNIGNVIGTTNLQHRQILNKEIPFSINYAELCRNRTKISTSVTKADLKTAPKEKGVNFLMCGRKKKNAKI